MFHLFDSKNSSETGFVTDVSTSLVMGRNYHVTKLQRACKQDDDSTQVPTLLETNSMRDTLGLIYNILI